MARCRIRRLIPDNFRSSLRTRSLRARQSGNLPFNFSGMTKRSMPPCFKAPCSLWRAFAVVAKQRRSLGWLKVALVPAALLWWSLGRYLGDVPFNMSRTFVKRQNRAWPQRYGVRPSPYISPSAATSACLTDARLCSLISARGDLSLGNPLLRLRLLRRTDSLCTRVAPWALAEKGPEVRLNGFGSNRFRGDWLMCGGPPPTPPRP